MENFHLRDEDWVDEVVRSQICNTGLPVSECWVEIATVDDGLCRCLHLYPEAEKWPVLKHRQRIGEQGGSFLSLVNK